MRLRILGAVVYYIGIYTNITSKYAVSSRSHYKVITYLFTTYLRTGITGHCPLIVADSSTHKII